MRHLPVHTRCTRSCPARNHPGLLIGAVQILPRKANKFAKGERQYLHCSIIKLDFSSKVVLCLLVIAGVALVVEPDLVALVSERGNSHVGPLNGSESTSLAEMGQRIGTVASVLDYVIGISLSLLSSFTCKRHGVTERKNSFINILVQPSSCNYVCHGLKEQDVECKKLCALYRLWQHRCRSFLSPCWL